MKKVLSYMNVKSLAYDALVEYAISSLPIRIREDGLRNVYISSWEKYLLEHAKPKHGNIFRQDGTVMCLGVNPEARYVIFYHESLPEERKQWVVAKLLYYIRCGFAEEHVGEYIIPDEQAKAAEFASFFLCPDAILEECGIRSAEDIMHHCQVPFPDAMRKARYLKNGYKRYELPSLEKMVVEQFSHDIQRVKSE